MKLISLRWIFFALAMGCLRFHLAAQTNLPPADLTQMYTSYGTLLILPFTNAPFPHPDRAEGHKYHQEFYSAAEHYSDNHVAIFLPKSFKAGMANDFVIHFHGWHHTIENTLTNYQLVEQFSASQRNAILIVPQGPHDAPDSFDGKLEDAGGFQRFMHEAVEVLHSRALLPGTNLGQIILSGHSGGYHVIGAILDRGGLTEHIREVWLFDALYGSTPYFTNWFSQPTATRWFNIYTLHGGTKEESERLLKEWAVHPAKAPVFTRKETELKPGDWEHPLVFIDSDLGHSDVIAKRQEFQSLLKTSVLCPVKPQ